MIWNRNDPAPVRVPGHEPGCDGHCNGACAAAIDRAWGKPPVRACWKCNARVLESEGRKVPVVSKGRVVCHAFYCGACAEVA